MTSAYRPCTTLWLALALQIPLAVFAQDNPATPDKAEDAAPLVLPAAPAKENLLPFYVSPSATMNFAIDAPSVSVTPDGIVRFTLVITSVLIVLLVLLHRAKGGGLSSLFGGGVQSSLSGSTVVEKNLDRVTMFVTGIWVVSIVGMALSIKYGV